MLEPHWAPGCFQAGFLLLRAGLVSLVLIRKQRRRPNPSGTQPGVFSCGNTAENTHTNEKRCVCVCVYVVVNVRANITWWCLILIDICMFVGIALLFAVQLPAAIERLNEFLIHVKFWSALTQLKQSHESIPQSLCFFLLTECLKVPCSHDVSCRWKTWGLVKLW